MTLLHFLTRTWWVGKWIVTIVAVLLLTIYFGWAFDSRGMLQLGPEHRIEFESEFKASQEEDTDWTEYLEIEKRLALELEERIPSNERSGSLIDRYSAESLSNPGNFPSNWNYSYEMSVPSPRGVAVLLHGMTALGRLDRRGAHRDTARRHAPGRRQVAITRGVFERRPACNRLCARLRRNGRYALPGQYRSDVAGNRGL
jgi:hypothetical protein